MARSYAPLMTSIWANADFVALSPEAQRVYLLAMSQPNVTYCGVVAFTARRWARMSSDTNADQIEDAIAELSAAGFVILDEETEELWVRSFVRHNGVLTQPQLAKAMDRSFGEILSDEIRAAFLAELPADLPKACVTLTAALGQPSGSLPAPPGLDDPNPHPDMEPSDDDAAGSSSSGVEPHHDVWVGYANLVADSQAEPPTKRAAFVTSVARRAKRERGRRLAEYLEACPTASPETLARWLFDDIDPVTIDRPEDDPDFVPADRLTVIDGAA